MAVVLNDLYDYGLKIYQDTEVFKFSLDSLLLAEFVEIKKSDKKLLDLCSGNAPIPLILSSIYDISITGIELQTKIVELARKSIAYNKLENKVTILNINAIDTNNYFPGNNFDIITCNPPFFKVDKTSLINKKISKSLARHELTITIKDIIKISSNLLKDNGKFYLVHRPERLEEIIQVANQYHLHIKEMAFIYTNLEDHAIMVLLKFVKNAKLGMKAYSKIITRETGSYQNIFKRR